MASVLAGARPAQGPDPGRDGLRKVSPLAPRHTPHAPAACPPPLSHRSIAYEQDPDALADACREEQTALTTKLQAARDRLKNVKMTEELQVGAWAGKCNTAPADAARRPPRAVSRLGARPLKALPLEPRLLSACGQQPGPPLRSRGTWRGVAAPLARPAPAAPPRPPRPGPPRHRARSPSPPPQHTHALAGPQILISDICSRLDVDGLRGDLVINRAVKALVAFEGRTEVTLADIERIISSCLNHR
jgi:hypothetical protein